MDVGACDAAVHDVAADRDQQALQAAAAAANGQRVEQGLGWVLVLFDHRVVNQLLATGLWIVLIGSLAFVLIFPFTGYGERKSERSLIHAFQAHAAPGAKLVYLDTYPFSAGFYGNGAVSDVANVEALQQRLNQPDALFVALPNDPSPELDLLVHRRLRLIKAFRRHSLYEELPASSGG